MAKATEIEGSLKRLGGGRWQTRDERFTIEPQSGTWVVVDGEQIDDLGLPLIRGPFGSLGAAREAIAAARDEKPSVSPLAAKVATLRDRPAADPAAVHAPSDAGHTSASKPKTTEAEPPARPRDAQLPAKPTKREPKRAEPRPEPRWILDLAPPDRRRARELIARLTDAGASDPEGIARRDIVGKVPAAAAYALARAIENLGPQATPVGIARLMAGGRDVDLDVRWRVVDGDGRPITLDLSPRGRPPRS
jgi:hypothetical protein